MESRWRYCHPRARVTPEDGRYRDPRSKDTIMIDLMDVPAATAQTPSVAMPIGAPGSLLGAIEDAIVRIAPATGWTVEFDIRQSPWIRVGQLGLATPGQGWKLHMSAAPDQARTVLERALDVLLREPVAFKVAHSLRFLAELNHADGGMSQIGKFITVYPATDDQAVDLARKLDEATRGLAGPAVPSDHPFLPGSLVHYRYGGFEARYLQLPSGEIVPAIADSAGNLVPDKRETRYTEPEWVTNPFPAWTAEQLDSSAQPPLLAGRFAPLAMLHGSPRGNVMFALDVERLTTCVVKQVHVGMGGEEAGMDTASRLRHEASVLARLGTDPRFPSLHGLFEDDGGPVVAMTDMAGQTLSAAMMERTQVGHCPTDAEVIAGGTDLANLIGAVHAHGLVHRDIKSTNVLRADDGSFRLIDFELAHDIRSAAEPLGSGTRGYMSSQQERREQPAVTDDIHALGALLYLLATGVEPSQAPDPANLLSRPVELLNPGIGSAVTDVIARCLAPDPADRFPSTEAVADALQAAAGSAPRPRIVLPEPLACDRARQQARRLGETLVAASLPLAGGLQRAWRSTHPNTSGFLAVDLNTGGAGSVLALADLVDEFDAPGWRDVLAAGASWLVQAERPGGDPLPGLYVGRGGAVAAIYRAGVVLDDPVLIATAIDQANWLATLPYVSPDLFNGTAGRIRLHLMLADHDRGQLEHAMAGGEDLLARAEPAPGGGLRWQATAPSVGEYSIGYAHGTAGIGDVLLDLFEATGDQRFRDAAAGAATWLVSHAHPFLPEGDGWAWPNREGEPVFGGFWCHGAAGVGRFMLHAGQHDLVPGAMALARGAARSVATATRWAGPTQCHGLAGNIEFLLDFYLRTHDLADLQAARDLGQLLDTFAVERDGLLMWASDSPDVYSPDYTIGYAGVAACLLRLADPGHRPHQMSLAGFRYRAGGAA